MNNQKACSIENLKLTTRQLTTIVPEFDNRIGDLNKDQLRVALFRTLKSANMMHRNLERIFSLSEKAFMSA